MINQSEFVAKINVKDSSELSVKIDAGWYKRVRIFYENRQPKRVRTFNESEGRKRVKNVYNYIS